MIRQKKARLTDMLIVWPRTSSAKLGDAIQLRKRFVLSWPAFEASPASPDTALTKAIALHPDLRRRNSRRLLDLNEALSGLDSHQQSRALKGIGALPGGPGQKSGLRVMLMRYSPNATNIGKDWTTSTR